MAKVAALFEGTAYRWPTRLAAAIDAEARHKPMEARDHLKGMPAWPKGSRLEEVRQCLRGRLFDQ